MAVIIIFLLFSSVAVIANTFTSKIGILCITIGMAILMSVMHMTIPLTVKTQTDYLQEQYGLNFKVRPLMTSKNRQPQIKKNVGLNVFSDNNNTYDIIQKINQKTDHFVETYLDVGGQMNKLFFATDVNDSVFN
jgi:predicted transcriptional regulator YheO